MSIRRIYMSGSIRVHKCSRRPCMPEYGSELRTLHLYVCICICEACKRYLSMQLSVMKIIGVDVVVVWIFCSFNDVFISFYIFLECFQKLIGLLSDYHNRCQGKTPFPLQSVSEFFQLWPWTPLAFFRLSLPPSSRNTLEYFLLWAPSSRP